MSLEGPAAGGRAALEIQGLTAGYQSQVVVHDVSLSVGAGRILGLAGESGCGKSTLALAAMGFSGGGLRIHGGRSLVAGEDLLGLNDHDLRARWGSTIAYVPQGAAASLNPTHTVATHFRLMFRRHLRLRRRPADRLAADWLARVNLPSDTLGRFPHQLSGGQQQRVSLALALSCEPRVVILDEPTTGLDVTTQAQVSAMLRRMVDDMGLAAVYVSHDLALLGALADEVAVMYAGEIVEVGGAKDVLRASRHPYSRALLESAPSVDSERRPVGIPGSPPSSVVLTSCAYAPRCSKGEQDCHSVHPALAAVDERLVRCHHPVRAELATMARPVGPAEVSEREGPSILTARNLSCSHRTPRGDLLVVDRVSFTLAPGETLAVVGESGSGKSTLLRTLAGIHGFAEGDISFDGKALPVSARHRASDVRGAIQLVFQNSDLALNPRRTVGDAIGRSLKLFRPDVAAGQRRPETLALLDAVRLPNTSIDRLPGELSGGQRQRVAFARAFASQPRVLLCDEVTSALDVSVQATILALVAELSSRFQTSVLFVSHDLAVVRSIADRIAVMQGGRICETATTAQLFSHPESPYTRQLLASVPSLNAVRPARALSDVG